MKILHCCLAAFYIDNYGYQENILPKMHKLQGHDVLILASTETFVDNTTLGYLSPGNYMNSDGIPVHRIAYSSLMPHKLATKLRRYKNTYLEIKNFKPDVIFMHDIQFLDIDKVVKYVKKHPDTKLFVDGHTDFSNSARTFFSKYILHSLIYRRCANKIEPFTKYFYGTLPARVDFFINFYKMPVEKTKLLVMGADDIYVKLAKQNLSREKLRLKYNISDSDFLIITGGKIDASKRQTLDLLKAVHNIGIPNIKLLVFGSIIEELKNEFENLCDGTVIQFVGWIPSEQSYDYFEAADLIVFPGRHSVLWEQAVGQGKPCVFREYPGHTHIDLDGNCKFLHSCTENEIKNTIIECIQGYDKMKEIAENKGMKQFSYFEIAKYAIEQ